MFWIQKLGNGHNSSGYRLFYAEYADDIDRLPTSTGKGTQTDGNTTANDICALGSECLLLEGGVRYVLTREGWRAVAVNGIGSGSDSGVDTDNEVTHEDIDELFKDIEFS